jgi:hypothetical protein
VVGEIDTTIFHVKENEKRIKILLVFLSLPVGVMGRMKNVTKMKADVTTTTPM